MQVINIKSEASKMINQLADDFTWDDLMYTIYVRQAIESGLKDSNTNQFTETTDILSKFGLPN